VGGCADFLHPFVWMQFCYGSDKGIVSVHHIFYKIQKKYDRDPGNDETSIWGRKHEPCMGV
jgi:hypothetical protein